MGCGCERAKIGTVPDYPFVIGEPDGNVIEVIARVNGWSFRRGEIGYVEGTEVQIILDAGWLELAA